MTQTADRRALAALVVGACVIGLSPILARLTRTDAAKVPGVKVRSLNERYDSLRETLNAGILDKKERRALAKARKRDAKATAKARSSGKRIYVLAFKGDVRASAVKRLAKEIDAVLTVARAELDDRAQWHATKRYEFWMCSSRPRPSAQKYLEV